MYNAFRPYFAQARKQPRKLNARSNIKTFADRGCHQK